MHGLERVVEGNWKGRRQLHPCRPQTANPTRDKDTIPASVLALGLNWITNVATSLFPDPMAQLHFLTTQLPYLTSETLARSL